MEEIRQQMEKEDEQREKIIKTSREVLKQAKSAIYCLHRGEVSKAKSMVEAARSFTVEQLLPIAEQHPALRFSGALTSALEEWAEAAIFLAFVAESRLPSLADLHIVSSDEYLGGLLDFTGELNRYAVLRATKRDAAAVNRCREIVDRLHGEFLKFDFRNGQLRRKYDSLKYTLKKLEQIEYEQQFFVSPGSSAVDEAVDDGPTTPTSPKRARTD